MAHNSHLLQLNRLLPRRTILCLLHAALHLVAANIPTYFLSDYCSNTLDMAAAKVSAGRLLFRRPQQNIQSLDCHMLITAPGGKMLTFSFHKFDLKSSHGCSSNYLQIFNDVRQQLPLTEQLCNSNRPSRTYVTSGEDAVIRVRKEQFQGDAMELVFTAFRFSPCSSGEYVCNNAHCIAQELYCNGYDNCGDRSDICVLRKGTIIGIVVVTAIVIFICVIVTIILLIRRQRKIRRERVSG
ncbi:hypothetical protein BsWGS_15999 [Bradybaena similaris]